ncbi:hypothetical protein [Streptococcus pluranimalium]|uniref:hypothetical protein n=1 Tax=Streptococcus pluranimalium TaxID=82348 RepID=UPI004046F535
MKIKFSKNSILSLGLDLLIWLISFALFFLDNTYLSEKSFFYGIVLVVSSSLLLWKYRNDKLYIVAFGVLLYINLSIFAADILASGKLTLPAESLAWQVFRRSPYEIKFLKALTFFVSTLNLFLRPQQKLFQDNLRDKVENRDNFFAFLFGVVLLIYSLITGYSTTVGASYLSQTSVIYEYALLFFLLTWYYAGNSKFRHLFLQMYAIIYVFQAIFYGDRSSAFPMVVLLVVLYMRRIPLWKIILFTLLGIMAANVISVYRISYSLQNFLENYFGRYELFNFASDTVSMSYYTGISLIAVRDMIRDTTQYFDDFLIGIFLGGGYGHADIVQLAKQFTTNKGGGTIVGNFVFWFEKFGIATLSIIVSLIINKIGKAKSDIERVWKIYITIMVFRWYLYTSFVFFRSICVVFPIAFLVFDIIDSVSSGRKYTFTKSFKERE